jgi:hypothetical protein
MMITGTATEVQRNSGHPPCDLPFATLNLKDFEDFAEHHGLKLFGP